MMAVTAVIWVRRAMNSVSAKRAKEVSRRRGGQALTTKGGPHGHVHCARNFISESGRPCVFHAVRKRHDAIPMDSQAIYTRNMRQDNTNT